MKRFVVLAQEEVTGHFVYYVLDKLTFRLVAITLHKDKVDEYEQKLNNVHFMAAECRRQAAEAGIDLSPEVVSPAAIKIKELR